MSPVLTRNELISQVVGWHKDHLKIVLTNGCFDLVHVGHLRTFKEAKKFGDILIVGLNSDQSVRNLKGETRPVISQEERAELISSFKPVDFVTIFDDPTAVQLIEIIKPHVYVKGGDYTIQNLPERDIIMRLQVTVEFVPLIKGISTTELVDRIRKANI